MYLQQDLESVTHAYIHWQKDVVDYEAVLENFLHIKIRSKQVVETNLYLIGFETAVHYLTGIKTDENKF
jgi:hypothetical protein